MTRALAGQSAAWPERWLVRALPGHSAAWAERWLVRAPLGQSAGWSELSGELTGERAARNDPDGPSLYLNPNYILTPRARMKGTGSVVEPLTRTSKCRWQPVEPPVVPTRAMS